MIGIHFRDCCNHNGPGKVVTNLRQGLRQAGVDFENNRICEKNGCLQSWAPLFSQLPPNTLCGPNLTVQPSDNPEIFRKFKNIALPSEWTRVMYSQYPETEGCRFFLWPVGIDTDLFTAGKNPLCDCLVYIKNRDQTEVSLVLEMLKAQGQSYRMLTYGSYTEQGFIAMLKEFRYVILLTHTESQGIAYMEILSTGTPCFVFDKKQYTTANGRIFEATSVPYFDERCGIITDLSCSNYPSLFRDFLRAIDSYDPRGYILGNHTLKKSAEKYLDILQGIS